MVHCARERTCVSVLLLLDLSTAAARRRGACVREGGQRLWRRASRAYWIAREFPGRGMGLPVCRASMHRFHGAMPKAAPSSVLPPWGEPRWTACSGVRSDRKSAAACRHACSRHAAEQHHELLVIQLVNVPSARLAQRCVRAAQARARGARHATHLRGPALATTNGVGRAAMLARALRVCGPHMQPERFIASLAGVVQSLWRRRLMLVHSALVGSPRKHPADRCELGRRRRAAATQALEGRGLRGGSAGSIPCGAGSDGRRVEPEPDPRRRALHAHWCRSGLVSRRRQMAQRGTGLCALLGAGRRVPSGSRCIAR
jgi:hypothetical protein